MAKIKTVGILGGGQLARMLALSGATLELQFQVVDSNPDACAGQVANLHCADYRDFAALAEFVRQVDVVTFDFENVPAETADWIAQYVPVYPVPSTLAVAQDRYAEKKLFQQLGILTPAFHIIESFTELQAAVAEIRLPCVLKTRYAGYDGKGQYRIFHPCDIEAAWQKLQGNSLILESFIDFSYELSVVAVRSQQGELKFYPLTQNWHKNGILSASFASAARTIPVQELAYDAAQKVADALRYVGVFALELFVTQQGQVMANEMAPRVHNSGHWTIEGAVVSQFENHLRAICGLPLGATHMLHPYAVMLNWVDCLPVAESILSMSDAYWHNYGKTPRLGRKLGHATVCAEDAETLAKKLKTIAKKLQCENQIIDILHTLNS